MKILVLGGDGMLGHQLVRTLADAHTVHATFRCAQNFYLPLLDEHTRSKNHYEVDARDFSKVESVVHSIQPDAIVNSIGIVKQRADASDSILSIEINSLFPHRVAALAQQQRAKFVTVSTDCVFTGRGSRYKESDVADAGDLYGRSKLLGEIYDSSGLTLRTSIIGLELTRKSGLIEWFLAQKEEINGYARAIYSGLTTVELSRVIERCLTRVPSPNGLYHVSSDPISKFDLLCGLRDRLESDIRILKDEQFTNDKSLDSSRFRNELGYDPPSWDVMLDELAAQVKERNE